MGVAKRKDFERKRLEELRKEMGAPPWVIAPINWVLKITLVPVLGGLVLLGAHIYEAWTRPGSEPREHWAGRRWLWK